MDGLETELVVATVKVAKEVAEDIVRPTSQSIGANLGLMVEGVMGWLGCWGEKQKFKQLQNVQQYKQQIISKISIIPTDRLCEPKINIVGPAIEASKYFFEEQYYRDMFSSLIASSCDNYLSGTVHPAFVEIIKQLSPSDAKLLSVFKYHNTYPMADAFEVHSDGKITPFLLSIFDFKDKNEMFKLDEYLKLTSSLENLIRLGIVVKNNAIFELNYNYEAFREHWLFKGYQIAIESGSKIQTQNYRIELNELGRAFVKCCF